MSARLSSYTILYQSFETFTTKILFIDKFFALQAEYEERFRALQLEMERRQGELREAQDTIKRLEDQLRETQVRPIYIKSIYLV